MVVSRQKSGSDGKWRNKRPEMDLCFLLSYLSDSGWSYLKGDCAPAAGTIPQIPISLKVLGTC